MLKLTKLTKEQSDAVEQEALRMYDQQNPRPDRRIKVSKAKCIKDAREKLYPSK